MAQCPTHAISGRASRISQAREVTMTGRHIALVVFASLLATTESALSETPCTDTSTTCADEGIAPKAKRVTLVSWDTSGTGALTYDVNGALFTAYVTTLTKMSHAPIAKYTPPAPVIPLVEDWKATIADGAKVFGSLEPE